MTIIAALFAVLFGVLAVAAFAALVVAALAYQAIAWRDRDQDHWLD